jgi:hypothetical protein
MDKTEHIGVVVVHGIGEQRRFEHIDWQVRCIVSALKARPNATVTVEITRATSGAYLAEHDTWGAGPTVRVVVSDPRSGKLLHIYFHEVWWADVNEPYSLSKQLRFWGWGLSVWVYPGKEKSTLATAASVRPPRVAYKNQAQALIAHLWVRSRLFGVAFVAVIGACSVGMLTFLAERILSLRTPDLIKVFVNYVAGVKLYNQHKRFGAGFPPKSSDFLDALDDPPRVSVRRRMIRTIMDMAEGVQQGGKRQPYDRWYVLAHSLGSIVAFNGLMETAYAWTGYFDESHWNEVRAQGLVGQARPEWQPPPPTDRTSPRRPVWANPRDVAYRSRIFERFHGLLTFGSPLEKFAAIWPARVPISREPAFRPGTSWLNVYDPVDPVSGVLRAFESDAPRCCPKPVNIGYAAGNFLLLNHLKYLDGPNNSGTLADGVTEWLITGNDARISDKAGKQWFVPYGSRHKIRTVIAYAWWIAIIFVLTLLGAIILPTVWSALTAACLAIWQKLISLFQVNTGL